MYAVLFLETTVMISYSEVENHCKIIFCSSRTTFTLCVVLLLLFIHISCCTERTNLIISKTVLLVLMWYFSQLLYNHYKYVYKSKTTQFPWLYVVFSSNYKYYFNSLLMTLCRYIIPGRKRKYNGEKIIQQSSMNNQSNCLLLKPFFVCLLWQL